MCQAGGKVHKLAGRAMDKKSPIARGSKKEFLCNASVSRAEVAAGLPRHAKWRHKAASTRPRLRDYILKNWTNDAGISMKTKDRCGKVSSETGNVYANKDT
jgi:hypothetical protein